MRRKPSASHCVKKPSFDAYRPISLVFLRGSMRTTVSSVNASGTPGMVRCSSSSVYSVAASVAAVDRDRLELELVAVEDERRLRGPSRRGCA